MTTDRLIAIVAAASIAMPAMAQSTDDARNIHDYNGGPKTVVFITGKQETSAIPNGSASDGHHYTGGLNTATPQHKGDKKNQ